VGVDGIEDVHVRSVIELYLPGLLSILLREIAPKKLVLLLQLRVVHGPDFCDPGVTIVEGRALHEGAADLVPLGAVQLDVLQCE